MFVLVKYLRHDLNKEPDYCRLVISNWQNWGLTSLNKVVEIMS